MLCDTSDHEVDQRKDADGANQTTAVAAVGLGAVYIVFSTTYAVLAFRNFTLLEVVAALIAVSILPSLLLFLQLLKESQEQINLKASAMMGMFLAGLVLFATQLSGLVRGSDYFSNFSTERMAVSESGFHQDSAFHVSLIHGILENGYPTTGQHLNTFTPYHVLSHYFDAGLLLLLRFDPWDSYALLFYAKITALILSMIYFVLRSTSELPVRYFWMTVIPVVIAFTASWHAVASHGQWVPMMVLVIAAWRVHRILCRSTLEARGLVFLLLLTIGLSLGKISIGLAFGLVVGSYLLFRHGLSSKVVGYGASIGIFFLLSGQVFASRTAFGDTSDWFGRFRSAWPDVFAVLMLAFLLVVLRRCRRSSSNLALAGSLLACLLMMALATTFALTNFNDVFYFFHGLFSVALLLAVPRLAAGFSDIDSSLNESNARLSKAFTVVVFAVSLMFALSPNLRNATFFIYSSPQVMLDTLRAANTVTYRWYNQQQPDQTPISVRSIISGARLNPVDAADLFPIQFRTQLERMTRDIDASVEGKPVLFVSAEEFGQLGPLIGAQSVLWATGLGIVALTGVPLVFGVDDSGRSDYGFVFYEEDARWLNDSQDVDGRLCGVGRPVVRIRALEQPSFYRLC